MKNGNTWTSIEEDIGEISYWTGLDGENWLGNSWPAASCSIQEQQQQKIDNATKFQTWSYNFLYFYFFSFICIHKNNI